MYKIQYTFIFLLFGFTMQAQQAGNGLPADKAPADGIQTIECAGFIQPTSDDIYLAPQLFHKMSENESADPAVVMTLKREAERQRSEKLKALHNSGIDAVSQTLGSTVPAPVIGKNFIGNYDPTGCPQDNTVAVSKGGKMVCIVNSVINYYDITAGTYSTHTFTKTLNAFYNGLYGMGVNKLLCDPKVIYDPVADRFIMYAQTCVINDTATHILISFSKSNDPAGGWYVYKFSGNAKTMDKSISTSTWSDYPKMGISTNELFVTVNEFDLKPSFQGVSIYELNKASGYSGSALKFKYWSSVSGASHGITGSPFTLMPVSQGQGSSYGPGIWMVCTDNAPTGFYGSSAIYCYHITDDMTSGSQKITTSTATLGNSYKLWPRIPQKGDTTKLDNGDCRMQNGFYLNGIIHCVFTSENSSNVNSINYSRIDVSSGSAGTTKNVLISDSKGADICYPAVASFSPSYNNHHAVITFVRASSKLYPEFDALRVDDSMNVSSIVTIKTGNYRNIDCYDGNKWASRWGDYTGICFRPMSTGVELWTAGSYGDGTASYNYWSTYIAQIARSGVGINEIKSPVSNQVIAPNPASDYFRYTFTLTTDTRLNIVLLDVTGKLMSIMFNGMAQEGENTFTFNRGALPAGIYLLRISDGNNVLGVEKVVVTH